MSVLKRVQGVVVLIRCTQLGGCCFIAGAHFDSRQVMPELTA